MDCEQYENIEALIAWCDRERRMMTRQIDLMQAGKMYCHGSDGDRTVDETPDWMADAKRRIAELDDLLKAIRTHEDRASKSAR